MRLAKTLRGGPMRVAVGNWDRSDLVSDYYNERFGRDVKLDDAGQWSRINAQKVAAARVAAAPGAAQP